MTARLAAQVPGPRWADRTVAGRSVGPVALGGARLSLGRDRPDEETALRTIHAALDAGVRLIDTSDVYCAGADEAGHNERLIAKALRRWSGPAGDVLVATKGGQWWDRAGKARFDGNPARLRAACEASLACLGVEALGLYLLHRLPSGRQGPASEGPELAASLETLLDLKEQGKVREIGLSNVTARQLDELGASQHLGAIENAVPALSPEAGDELAWCDRHDVAFLAWGTLAGTVPGGSPSSPGNVRRASALARVARRRGVSVQQVALAALLTRSPHVVPLVGARRPETILDSVQAVHLVLAPHELEELDRAVVGHVGT